MTYQNNYPSTSYTSNPNPSIGLPGAGFASRGKANGIKRLNLASLPKLGSLNENGVDDTPPPRTSRLNLLQGLRTAPKTAPGPSTAPGPQPQFNGMPQQGYPPQQNAGMSVNNGVPHTSSGSTFPQHYAAGQQFYSLPEQVLAPPNLEFHDAEEDPQMLAQLQATKSMLAMRQQLLQQQLAALTMQHQLAAMNINGMPQMFNGPATPSTPSSGLPNPGASMYNQQLLANMQPIVQEVPGRPGIYTVYNPLTGQTTLAADTSGQDSQLAHSPAPSTPAGMIGYNSGVNTPNRFSANSGYGGNTPSHLSANTSNGYSVTTPNGYATPGRRHISPQHEIPSPFGVAQRSISPPKKTPSPPVNVEPLPPPSANAFRRGHHKKVSSLSLGNNGTPIGDAPKSAFIPRSHVNPATPLTGTFGPGQARAGEHPTRQPRGPPAMEELKAKPTSHFEGSKNFAARRRRQAVTNLVQAGLHRRIRPDSAGSVTPVSESELTFSVPSDNDSDSGRSVHGAIGSERKSSRESLKGAGAVRERELVVG